MKCDFKNCEIKPFAEITYDCGPDPDQKLKLCNDHYNFDSCFNDPILVKGIEVYQ